MMKKNSSLQLQIDKDSVLFGDLLHDSEVFGLSLEPSGERKKLIINLRTENKKKINLVCEAVRDVYVSSFSLQNVVFEVECFIGVDAREELELLKENFGLKERSVFESILEKIKNRELTFIHLSPSVGCELYCICGKVELFEM